ncbi:MAG: hypothetical protein AAFQ67_03980 [Pseudomonadota bacterium]
MKSLKFWIAMVAIVFGLGAQSGCIVAAAAAGGFIAADEIAEDDGEFDPFEDIIEDITDTEDGEDG